MTSAFGYISCDDDDQQPSAWKKEKFFGLLLCSFHSCKGTLFIWCITSDCSATHHISVIRDITYHSANHNTDTTADTASLSKKPTSSDHILKHFSINSQGYEYFEHLPLGRVLGQLWASSTGGYRHIKNRIQIPLTVYLVALKEIKQLRNTDSAVESRFEPLLLICQLLLKAVAARNRSIIIIILKDETAKSMAGPLWQLCYTALAERSLQGELTRFPLQTDRFSPTAIFKQFCKG